MNWTNLVWAWGIVFACVLLWILFAVVEDWATKENYGGSKAYHERRVAFLWLLGIAGISIAVGMI